MKPSETEDYAPREITHENFLGLLPNFGGEKGQRVTQVAEEIVREEYNRREERTHADNREEGVWGVDFKELAKFATGPLCEIPERTGGFTDVFTNLEGNIRHLEADIAEDVLTDKVENYLHGITREERKERGKIPQSVFDERDGRKTALETEKAKLRLYNALEGRE